MSRFSLNKVECYILQVRKTETIQNNLNPSWKLIYISMSELCDSDASMPIRLAVFDNDHNSHDDMIGQTETTLRDLMGHRASGEPLVLKIGEKRRGELYVRQCEAENTQTRKISNSCYPERKASNASLHNYSPCYSQPQPPTYMEQLPQPHLAPPQEVYRPILSNQQAPMENPYYQPTMPYQQPHQLPQMNYLQPQMNYQQAPIDFYQQAQVPQHSAFLAFPEDPTDQRPQSIWINKWMEDSSHHIHKTI